MSEAQLVVRALGSGAEASLPEYGKGSELARARYLRIALKDDASRSGIFAVNPVVRAGATDEIFLLPGQLGLTHGERAPVSVVPASAWAYRRAQLFTPTGALVLGVLCTALISAGIDGSLALGKQGLVLGTFKAATLNGLAAVSMACKLLSAVLAFLLALWFKK
ncbi:MAG: hypothetical protein K5880_05075 [Hydrogenophaga sp.]|uniref:hypothetical protein n=1 Tax=Hydrogenophaga sp. TaxID=1904254 RepID=UPI00263529F4|nr:hypothetical protein [Hydrogenophaga sp.]MCV0437980.1 hypothetical protein [Hydrogenophaga sp.]